MLKNVRPDQIVVNKDDLVNIADQIVKSVDRLNHVVGILLEEAKSTEDPERFKELSSSIKDIFSAGDEAVCLGHNLMDIVKGK